MISTRNNLCLSLKVDWDTDVVDVDDGADAVADEGDEGDEAEEFLDRKLDGWVILGIGQTWDQFFKMARKNNKVDLLNLTNNITLPPGAIDLSLKKRYINV